MPSRVLEVIDGLDTLFATVTIDGAVRKGWEIYTIGVDKELIFVAGQGGEFGTEDIATTTIEWPGMSPISRIEDGTVDCAISVWTGDHSAVDATIARAYEIFDDCETALRGNPSLSSTIALQAKIVTAGLRMSQEAEGFLVLIPFVVAFQTSV